MSEIADIGQHLMTMRESIAAFTEAANARREWENFLERDATGLAAAIEKMTKASNELSTSIDRMTEKTQLVTESIDLAQVLLSNYEAVIAQIESSLDIRMNALAVQIDDKIDHKLEGISKKFDVSWKALLTRIDTMDSNLKIKLGKSVEDNRANNALETRKVLIEVEKLKNLISENFIFRLGLKKKEQ